MPDEALTKADAQAIVREVASEDVTNVHFTFHAQQRMDERGEDPGSIIRGLRRGVAASEPEYVEAERAWKVVIDAPSVDEDLRIPVAIELNVTRGRNRVTVITVYPRATQP